MATAPERLEALLLTGAIITASVVIIAGPFGAVEKLGKGDPSVDVQIAAIHTTSARQAIALAAMLVALRRFGHAGPRPPK
jgi:hypothetical protein